MIADGRNVHFFGGEMSYIYKIKNGEGRYSNGGKDPKYTNEGKVWVNKKALNCHLSQKKRWKREVRDITDQYGSYESKEEYHGTMRQYYQYLNTEEGHDIKIVQISLGDEERLDFDEV